MLKVVFVLENRKGKPCFISNVIFVKMLSELDVTLKRFGDYVKTSNFAYYLNRKWIKTKKLKKEIFDLDR